MDILLLSYFLIFSFFLILVEYNFPKSIVGWIFIFAISVFITFRSLDVPDTDAYVEFFKITSTDFDDYYLFSFEIGFQILAKVIKLLFGDSFRFLFLFVAFLNYTIFFSFYRKIVNLILNRSDDSFGVEDTNSNFVFNCNVVPLLLYTSFFGLYLNSIVIRVGLAMALVYYASTYLVDFNRNIFHWFKIVFLLILAYLMHSSAFIAFIICSIIYFSKGYQMKFYYLFLFLIGVFYYFNFSYWIGQSVFTFITTWNNFFFLFSKLDSYQQNIFVESGISMKFTFFWFLSFFLVKFSVNSSIYYKYFNVYIFGLIIFSIFRSVLLIERVTDYFFVSSFMLFFLSVQRSNLKFSNLIYIFLIFIQILFVVRIANG